MKRRTAAWLAGLLIIAQVMLGPVSHAMAAAPMDGHCSHAAGMAGCEGDCGMCPGSHGQAPQGGTHDHSGTPSHHARCACPCASTPAMTPAGITATRPATPVALAGDLSGPARTPPIFDFLRPPN